MLYLVATPIGNLKDITFRAIETLKECDIIACEDTRHTIKLLNHYQIKKQLISYHEHNKMERGAELVELAKQGKNIALVTDAGCPAISDPGEDLVRLFYENELEVSVIPGPSAFISALMISGMPTTHFVFMGFLSQITKKRKAELDTLRDEKRTMIFYEAPHKLMKTLVTFEKLFGCDREIALVKEITKIYENVRRGTIEEILDDYKEKTPKGEFVVIVKGNEKENAAINIENTIEERYQQLLSENYDRKEAMRIIAMERNLSRKDIYSKLNK
ncbi:MAG: 16S rRNA (cytidine(1402)-2'-O)-methyltransferase [Clostridia bacterium]|nr:16S rRNA (cytidine(1402)-2'-O)-methyltransferase [Clostridia bacterium]